MTGNTAIDSGELDDLIPSLSLKAELDEFERENILRAHEWAFSPRVLKRVDLLTERYVRSLHKRMLGDTWRWAGKYRRSEKNIGVTPHLIVERTAVLLDDARYWLEHETYSVDEIAVRFHHRLVFIHPFPNGNGRHSRLMADVIAARNGCEPFTWGGRNLQDIGPAREAYLAALQEADGGDIEGLLEFARG